MDILIKFFHLIGIPLLIWILYAQINLSKLLSAFSNISLPFFLLSLVSMLLLAILKYTRIFLLLKVLHIKLNPITVLRIYTSSLFIGQVTNFIFSTLSATTATIVLHKGKKKLQIGNVYIISNLFDFLFSIIILIILLFLNKEIRELVNFHLKYAKITIFIAFITFITFGITSISFNKNIRKHTKYLIEELKIFFQRSLLITISITTIIWFLYILTCFLEAKCFGISISITYLVITYILGSIITALPISIAGLGTREIVFIQLLSYKGIPSEIAFALSIFSYILNPTFSMVLLYIISYIYKRL